jgi:hypothetical protein
MPVPVLIRRRRGCVTRLSSLELASGRGLRGILQARRRRAASNAGPVRSAARTAADDRMVVPQCSKSRSRRIHKAFRSRSRTAHHRSTERAKANLTSACDLHGATRRDALRVSKISRRPPGSILGDGWRLAETRARPDFGAESNPYDGNTSDIAWLQFVARTGSKPLAPTKKQRKNKGRGAWRREAF